MGDEEETSQAQLLRETGGLRADVLKVAHHGSASQEPDWSGRPVPGWLSSRWVPTTTTGTRRRRCWRCCATPGCRWRGPTATVTWRWWCARAAGRARGARAGRLVTAEALAGWRVATYSFSQVDVFGRAPLTRQPGRGRPRRRPGSTTSRWRRSRSGPTSPRRPSCCRRPPRRRTTGCGSSPPTRSCPFAGHPTLGSAHAWLARAASPADRAPRPGVRRRTRRGARDEDGLAFRAPGLPAVRPGRRGDARRGRSPALRVDPGPRGARQLDRQRARLARPPARQRGGRPRPAARTSRDAGTRDRGDRAARRGRPGASVPTTRCARSARGSRCRRTRSPAA